MKKVLLIVVAAGMFFPMSSQNCDDAFENSIYHSGGGSISLEYNSPFQNATKENSWFRLQGQVFFTEPNLCGNNVFSINGHFAATQNFESLQFAPGLLFDLLGLFGAFRPSRDFEKYYEQAIKDGYDPEYARRIASDRVEPMSSDESKAVLLCFLMGLTSSGVHIPFSNFMGITAEWDLFNINCYRPEKKWFISGDVGGGLEVSLGKLLIKGVGKYNFLYKQNPYMGRYWYWGASLGVVL